MFIRQEHNQTEENQNNKATHGRLKDQVISMSNPAIIKTNSWVPGISIEHFLGNWQGWENLPLRDFGAYNTESDTFDDIADAKNKDIQSLEGSGKSTSHVMATNARRRPRRTWLF